MKAIVRIFFAALILLLLAAIVLPHIPNNKNLPKPQPDVPIPLAFDGSSTGLKATEIVPTLAAPIPKHKNVIWCASFLASWKTLEQKLAKGPVLLDPNPEMAKALNDAADPRPFVSPSSLFVAAGWNRDGIVDQIRKGMRRRFPDAALPKFPGITPDSFVTYAYLDAHIKFPIPYNQSKEPLVFTNSAGAPTAINAFGVSLEDANTYFKLRAEPRVIFSGDETWPSGSHGVVPGEFIIDLCPTSSPDQVLLAKIARPATLAAAVTFVESNLTVWGYTEHARQFEQEPDESGLRSEDVLLVPDVNWFISHRFSELEGRTFLNPGMKAQSLSIAQEDIAFCLDKSGAGVRAESREYMTAGPEDYIFNQPFLIYMKKRDAKMPYFAMWVDNAELLSPWSAPIAPACLTKAAAGK